jgi:hypothetical protein
MGRHLFVRLTGKHITATATKRAFPFGLGITLPFSPRSTPARANGHATVATKLGCVGGKFL